VVDTFILLTMVIFLYCIAWRCFYFGSSHDELGVVVLEAGQQLSGPPLQEVVQGLRGTLLHADLVPVGPDLQTGQRHADVQRPVEL